jgi:hypothetical protein
MQFADRRVPWKIANDETSEIRHFLGNPLTDGSEFVSPLSRPRFTPRKIPGFHIF